MCAANKYYLFLTALVILCCFLSTNCKTPPHNSVCNEDPRYHPVFNSEKDILDYLQNEQLQNNLDVRQLLFAYFNTCQSRFISYLPKPTRKPFIVVEGNHRTAKKMLAMRLSRRIGGSLINNPPKCLMYLRNFFPTGSLLLRAFFSLCSYAIAQNARRLINIFPIVVNGYWMEQQSHAIARSYGMNPPPEDHSIYQWPKDLLKPDIVFFVEFPDNLHKETFTTRAPDSLKVLAMNAVLRMNVPGVVMVNMSLGNDAALEFMERHVQERLGTKFRIQWVNATRGPPRIRLRNIRVKQA